MRPNTCSTRRMPALVLICDNGVTAPKARTGEANQRSAFRSLPNTSRASFAIWAGIAGVAAAFMLFTVLPFRVRVFPLKAYLRS